LSSVDPKGLWLYLKPSDIGPNGINSEKINEAMFNFAKDWANTNQSEMSEEFTSQDPESLDEAVIRVPQILRTRECAVTPEDFENVAKTASRTVVQILLPYAKKFLVSGI